MNKKDIIKEIASQTGLTQKDSEKFLNSFMETVEETLVKGEDIKLVGFGNFKITNRAERNGVNPATKEKIIIAASKSPSFKFSKSIKTELNK
jgi:DNA-binding protein HU-beta